MSDVFVLDMASQNTEQSQVFVRRDSLAILDNQNQNYNSNQSIIDTSQLANSNKYMNYREAYLTIPMLLTMTGAGSDAEDLYAPAGGGNSADWQVGLKNWYGSIIHSFTLDYNGTTICQQVPFSGLWNTFRLMTSFSLDDVRSQGSFIGFYPDTSVTAGFAPAESIYGVGTFNNQIQTTIDTGYVSGRSSWRSMSDPEGGPANAGVNMGLFNRIQAWNFDPTGGTSGIAPSTLIDYQSNFITSSSLTLLWQSYISLKADQTLTTNNGIWQASILGVVYLKHLHKFFECVPLLRSAFLKITLNLNITSVSFTTTSDGFFPDDISVQSPLGGVSPLMLTATRTTLNSTVTMEAEGDVVEVDTEVVVDPVDALPVGSYICSLSVGPECQNQIQKSLTYASGVGSSAVGKNMVGGGSITLNVPAYTFNPVFEQAYLSIGIKKIIYSDIYQFQYVNQIGGANIVGQQPTGNVFNFIVSNGIANIKSVLVLPFFSKGTSNNGIDGNMGILPIQSPFDPAGGGPTSPYIQLTQFNIQISGQNMIYNTERYSYEHFANQFKGVNAVDGGMADGTNSGLVGWKDWISSYNYYYVNCARMLPLEENVPKSITILGQSLAQKPIDLYVFTEYGTEISVDLATGARV